MVDTHALRACGSNPVWVRSPPSAQKNFNSHNNLIYSISYLINKENYLEKIKFIVQHHLNLKTLLIIGMTKNFPTKHIQIFHQISFRNFLITKGNQEIGFIKNIIIRITVK